MCPWFESRWYHNKIKVSRPRVAHLFFRPFFFQPENMNLDHPIHEDPEFDALDKYMTEKKPSQVVVVMDRTTEKCALPLIAHVIPESAHPFVLGDDGEGVKSIEHAHALWQGFEDVGVDRSSLVIALGGGAVTDLVGFVAGTFMRGVPCWLVPTTLLAMVDAAVGGKTGINMAGAKNRVGAFCAPVGVSVCANFTATLDDRSIRSGYAEHQKHFLISGAPALEVTRRWAGPKDGPGMESLLASVAASAGVKMAIVREDPLEQKARGGRAVLNFGHTAGHALESWAMSRDWAHGDLTHGEAVAWGMCVALHLSADAVERAGNKAGTWDKNDLVAEELRQEAAHLTKAVPCPANVLSTIEAQGVKEFAAELWATMEHDKKSRGGKIRWVLLQKVGDATAGCDVSYKEYLSAVQAVLAIESR